MTHGPGTHAHGSEDGSQLYPTLGLEDRVFAGLVDEMAGWLVRPGMRVLDAGCGAGGMAVAMARHGAIVEAVDPGAGQREATQALAAEHGLTDRVIVRSGDITTLTYEDSLFDLVWCGRVLHHVPDMQAAAAELVRVTRPGGRVALREGGLPFRVLPDDVGIGARYLEDRLAGSGVGRFEREHDLEGSAPYRFGWSRLLLDSGLESVEARTFATDSLSPLTADEQEWVLRHWRRWLVDGAASGRLAAADRDALAQLADEHSPYFAFNRDDLHLRAGHSVYVGTRSIPSS